MNRQSTTAAAARTPSSKRSFTLSQLQLEAGRRLANADPASFEGVRVSSPAMPTLKLWSKEGVFDTALTLDRAALVVIERVKAAPGRFKAPVGTLSLATSQIPETPHAAHDQTAAQSSHEYSEELIAMRASLGAMTARLNSMQKVNDMAYSAISRVLVLMESQPARAKVVSVNGQSVSSELVPTEIVRAIDQLDGIRKHVLMSIEREKQLGQQQSAPVSRMNEGVSALDVQRILARISNVEQNTIQIVQLLEGKLKQ